MIVSRQLIFVAYKGQENRQIRDFAFDLPLATTKGEEKRAEEDRVEEKCKDEDEGEDDSSEANDP